MPKISQWKEQLLAWEQEITHKVEFDVGAEKEKEGNTQKRKTTRQKPKYND